MPICGLSKPAITLVAALSPSIVVADLVELRAPDGFISIDGEITSMDATMITVRTSVGEVRIPKSEVSCFGASCPSELVADAGAQDVKIATLTPEHAAVVQNVLSSSAPSSSRSARRQDTPLLLSDEGSGNQAKISFVSAAADSTIKLIDRANAHASETETIAARDWVSATDLPSQLFGVKALSVIVSPVAGVKSITVPQLAQIFAGELKDWSEIGGNAVGITPIQTAAESALTEAVMTAILAPYGKKVTGDIFTMGDAEAIMRALKAIPGGVGIVPATPDTAARSIAIADSCGVTTFPSEFAIKSGTYPLTLSTIAEYATPVDSPLIHAAFDAATGPDTQGTIAEAGYLDTSLIALPADAKNKQISGILNARHTEGERQKAGELVQMMLEAEQLSVSFMAGDLDTISGAWSRAHFVHLAEAARAGALDGKDVIFVGYADDGNTAESRIAASQAAAEDILAAFRAFAPDAANRADIAFSASGHGAVRDVGCFHGDDAVSRGTKIEVWTRLRR